MFALSVANVSAEQPAQAVPPILSKKFNSFTDKIVLLRIVLVENEAKTVRLGN
jgi:translation elongation factor EF-Ts